jgi:hypothetical protein
MKKTAVDWLVQEFELTSDYPIIRRVIEQAKEMEKEQIKDAYSAGVWEIGYYNKNADAEEYYNKTYKQL